jgi:hypothetical protein
MTLKEIFEYIESRLGNAAQTVMPEIMSDKINLTYADEPKDASTLWVVVQHQCVNQGFIRSVFC